MIGPYIVIGVFLLACAFLLYAWARPKSKGYRLQSPIKKIQPKKKRVRKVKEKKKKSGGLWIRIM